MNKKQIIIRTAGNYLIGLGHIYRTIAVADMIKNYYEIIFILSFDTEISPIKQAGYKYIFLSETLKLNDEYAWFADNFPKGSIIIIDGYDFDGQYQKKLKNKDFKVVYIDDLQRFHIYADLLINHSPSVSENDYISEAYTDFALGTKYALLRKEFLQSAKNKRFINKIDTAFVCFGGSDFFDITYKVTSALLHNNEIKKINIVIGSAYRHTQIFNIQNKFADKIFIYKNLSANELIQIMQESNLAFVPASTILYEICSVKMPVICGYYADNQMNIYKSMTEKKAVFGIGKWQNVTVKDIGKVTKSLISNDISKYLSVQQELFDGKSSERILKKIRLLQLSMRQVTPADKNLLFEWVNDKDVRNNAINPKPITYEEHTRWFDNFLKKENSYIFIMLFKDKEVGQIRFDYDIEQNSYVIDYSIDKNYRGMGFGKEIVRRGILELQKKVQNPAIIAIVRSKNTASFYVFKNLNFKIIKQNEKFITFALNHKKTV